MTATRIGQLVGCSVLMLAMLVGSVASMMMPREGPTSDLVKWEQEKLANDEEYIKAVFFHGDTKLTSAITLWRDYIQPALAERRRLIDEVLVHAAGRKLDVAKEILYRAHRRAYALMAPYIQRIVDNRDELVRLDHFRLYFEHSLKSVKTVEGRLIRRVNNYFYETATEVAYGYSKALSDIYQQWDVPDDREAGELNDEAYYSGSRREREKDGAQPKARRRMFNGPGLRHGPKKELFGWEKEQLELDYQFNRAEISQAQPRHFFQFAAIHQIYAAIEERELIIYDAMNEPAIHWYSADGRKILFKAHRKAFNRMAPYLMRALGNIRALESDPHEFRRFVAMLLSIRQRFKRGLEEYSWRYEQNPYDEEDSAMSDSDDEMERLADLIGWNPNEQAYRFLY